MNECIKKKYSLGEVQSLSRKQWIWGRNASTVRGQNTIFMHIHTLMIHLLACLWAETKGLNEKNEENK